MKRLKFIEMVRTHLFSDDEVLHDTMMSHLRDYPQVPVDLTNELLEFCGANEAARKSVLSNGESFPKNEQSVELLLRWVHELPFNQKFMVIRFLHNVPIDIIVKYEGQLMFYVGRAYIEFCEMLVTIKQDSEQLWDLLIELQHQLEENYDANLFEMAAHVQDLLIALGEYDANEAKALLQDEQDDDYLSIKAIFAVRAVGVIKVEELIPVLVKLLVREEDLLLGKLVEALVQMQSDEVVKAIAPFILDPQKSISVITILKDIKTELAENVLVEAYEKTDDVTDHEFILEALTSHFSEETFPLINQFLARGRYARAFDMEEIFYGFYKAMKYDHPKLESWHKKVLVKKREFDLSIVEYEVKDIMRQKFGKIGRNDPCICDSGKKYKKCCGK